MGFYPFGGAYFGAPYIVFSTVVVHRLMMLNIGS